MLLVKIPDEAKLPNIPSGYKQWFLACEDAIHAFDTDQHNEKPCDWDYNDVVFLIYGNEKTSDPVNYKPDSYPKDGYVDRVVEKRYMIEDLTGYTDFDFNDVVVDCSETYKLKYTIQSEGAEPVWDNVNTE